MRDARVEEYARLLIDRCLGVQPKWQVVISTTPLARPLLEAAVKLIAERGAYALVEMNFASVRSEWAKHAPAELLDQPAGIDEYSYTKMDAYLGIAAPENTLDGSDVPADRQAALRRSRRGYIERVMDGSLAWVVANYPTPALAQDARMTLEQYSDFMYGACLIDWDALAKDMRRRADRLDAASEVHIVGAETDLRMSLQGRKAEVDEGHKNMPGGEFFYSPVEDATEGVITYNEYPAFFGGTAVDGVRLEFRGGKVVDASAKSNEEFLIRTLDSDAGARVLGELGIGCNPQIQKPTRDVLFDEKINGTVHLALGAGFPFIGGTNESNVHWDMVKNLRNGGQLLVDNVVVQENGIWKI